MKSLLIFCLMTSLACVSGIPSAVAFFGDFWNCCGESYQTDCNNCHVNGNDATRWVLWSMPKLEPIPKSELLHDGAILDFAKKAMEEFIKEHISQLSEKSVYRNGSTVYYNYFVASKNKFQDFLEKKFINESFKVNYVDPTNPIEKCVNRIINAFVKVGDREIIAGMKLGFSTQCDVIVFSKSLRIEHLLADSKDFMFMDNIV